MATCEVTGIRLAGIVASVPEERQTRADLSARFGTDTAARIIKATGIEERRIAGPATGSLDLAETAARHLLVSLNWPADTVDLLIFVTQTRDRVLPGDGYLLHHRLGLGKAAVVLDVTLGCSGFVQGLWTAATLLGSLRGRRALLITGDATSRLIDPDDRAVAPLFGDGVAATALVVDAEAPAMVFDMGSDGGGAPYLTAEGGGIGRPDCAPRLFMDGTQVFAFTLREVPDSLRAVLCAKGWSIGDVDHLVLHQANAQMIRHLAQKIAARPDQVVIALENFGNTSSASIPLALATALSGSLTGGPRRMVVAGFGVGWAWASAALVVGPLTVCTVVVRTETGGENFADPAKDSEEEANPAGTSENFAEPDSTGR